jgi:hypothetical protein
VLFEQMRDVALRLVDGRHHDVRGLFARHLDDVLAHVRLDAVDAAFGEVMVEFDFLARHRLAFDDALRPVPLRDGVDDGVGVVRGLGPVHLHAVGTQLCFELFQQFGQARKCVLAYGLAEVAQVFEFVGLGELRAPLALQEVHRAAKALAQLRVVERGAGARAEVGARHEMQRAFVDGAHAAASSVTMTTHSARGPCAP